MAGIGEDAIALLLWIVMVGLFLLMISLSGCGKGFSKASIDSEREETIDARRILLTYLNTELEYNNKNRTISRLVTELYITQDNTKKDEIQRLLNEKTKEIIGIKRCWTIIVLTNPRLKIESDKCKEVPVLHQMVGKTRVTTNIPVGTQNLEVEYQTYVFREKEIAGKH